MTTQPTAADISMISANYARRIADILADVRAQLEQERTRDEYNGWTNRETWATALHLSNDPNLYAVAQSIVIDADRRTIDWYEHHGENTDTNPMPALEQTHGAADALRIWVNDMVDDYHNQTEWSDPLIAGLIQDTGSFWRVDWHAVAESFRD